jgi:hypothetical protein
LPAGSHILCDPLGERRRQSRRTFAAPGADAPCAGGTSLPDYP